MTIKNRLAKLEAKRGGKATPRVIVFMDGKYTERGQVMTEAEYQAIADNPAYDTLLINVVRASDKLSEGTDEPDL